MDKVNFGKPLPPGGTVGIATPASPYESYSVVLRGIAWWEKHGYHVRLAEGALARSDWTAGSPELRARDLMQMFSDPTIDAIQCMRGGYGSAQIIPYLDMRVVSQNPKPFVGSSDITALHVAFIRLANLGTFYGPSLTSVGNPELTDFTARHFLQVLSGNWGGPFPRNPDDPFARALASGKGSGRLVGGCLSDLMHTLGTPWEIALDDAIFAFEEVGNSPHGIDRALLQLTQAGKLKRVRGIVVGELVGCEFDEGGGSPFSRSKTLEEMLEERLKPLGVPVLYQFPFGHGSQFATLPFGAQATIDGETCTLEIERVMD